MTDTNWSDQGTKQYRYSLNFAIVYEKMNDLLFNMINCLVPGSIFKTPTPSMAHTAGISPPLSSPSAPLGQI